MTGLNQFLEVFGDLKVYTVVVFVLALFFCYKGYKKFDKFMEDRKELVIQKYEAEKERDKMLKFALDEVGKYPQYREQSKKIQRELINEIDVLKKDQEHLASTQEEIKQTLNEMKEAADKRSRNQTRDRLLQLYRNYMNEKTNPSHSWTKMEAEAFWELFGDYEEAGGNGFMRTVVQPAMNLLEIVDE